jgi:predicted permease
LQFYGNLLEQVRALPGVREATISDWVPLSDDHNDVVVTVEDHPLGPNELPRVHWTPTVDPSYFSTLHIPLLAGRTFESPYRAQPSMDVIVSKAFADRYWPDGSPIGKRIRPDIQGPWFTIVGEVGNAHYASLDKPAEDAVYLPMSTPDSARLGAPRFVALFVKTNGHQDVSGAVRNIVHALDASTPTYDQRSFSSVVTAASSRAKITVLLLIVASTLALILGAVGLYGVMAYGVSLRQREIGVRIALGAQPSQVSRMISRQGLGLALVGIAIGGGVALGATRLLRGLLYDVSPTDPLTFAVACLGLLGMAGLASWVPARRAAAVDPADTLKSA